MNKNRVFEETYRMYLQQIGKIDYLAKADLLGVAVDGDSLVIQFYDHRYLVSPGGIRTTGGKEVSTSVWVILSKYVLHCQRFVQCDDDPYRTFRDFRDAVPLVSYFTTNTTQLLATEFSRKGEFLEKACLAVGGVRQENASYDCSMLFHALPKIPVMLNFNDTDEMFPASCSVLYKASAEQFLDMECLAMTGTLLASRLIFASKEY